MEVWVTEYRFDITKEWAISEVFTSYRIAYATAADANEYNPNSNWTRVEYRVRRYVPEPPPIPQGEKQ